MSIQPIPSPADLFCTSNKDRRYAVKRTISELLFKNREKGNRDRIDISVLEIEGALCQDLVVYTKDEIFTIFNPIIDQVLPIFQSCGWQITSTDVRGEIIYTFKPKQV